MNFIDEYNRLKATLDEGVCLLMLHYGHWYAFGKCAKDAIRSDPSIPLWRKSGAMEYLIHRDDEAWLCSFLAKMVRSGRSVALAEDMGQGYNITRIIRPGTVGKDSHDYEAEEGTELREAHAASC